MHCTSFQLSVNIRDNWDKYNHGLTTPIKSIPIKAICDDTYMACPCSDYSSHSLSLIGKITIITQHILGSNDIAIFHEKKVSKYRCTVVLSSGMTL